MPAYLVWRDGHPTRRTMSARSEISAASIFLGEQASPTPRSPAETDTPACWVALMPAESESGPIDPVSFWRSLPDRAPKGRR